MNILTCKDCKHWNNISDQYPKPLPKGIGQCESVTEFWEAFEWDDDVNNVPKPGYDDKKAFVQDGSDYSAMLLTRHNFYCNMFEVKA